jgi:mRNA interferase MazF
LELKRGDIVLCVAPGDYGKPRPAVIVQSDIFNPTHVSIVICPITSTLQDAPLFRLDVEPGNETGLVRPSQIMADKITALKQERIRARLGKIDEHLRVRLDRALALFLGFAR